MGADVPQATDLQKHLHAFFLCPTLNGQLHDLLINWHGAWHLALHSSIVVAALGNADTSHTDTGIIGGINHKMTQQQEQQQQQQRQHQTQTQMDFHVLLFYGPYMPLNMSW